LIGAWTSGRYGASTEKDPKSLQVRKEHSGLQEKSGSVCGENQKRTDLPVKPNKAFRAYKWLRCQRFLLTALQGEKETLTKKGKFS